MDFRPDTGLYFISKHLATKSTDLHYKYDFVNFSKHGGCRVKRSKGIINKINDLAPKVRVLAGFLDVRHFKTLTNIKILSSFLHQIFMPLDGAKIKLRKFNFGLKNAQEMYWFLNIRNTPVLNSFFFFLPPEFKEKLFPVGLLGTYFFYLRYLVLDIFNLFGAEFFQSFYLSYFDCQAIFSIDISCAGNNLLLNRATTIDFKFIYLQSFYSFFKLLVLKF